MVVFSSVILSISRLPLSAFAAATSPLLSNYVKVAGYLEMTLFRCCFFVEIFFPHYTDRLTHTPCGIFSYGFCLFILYGAISYLSPDESFVIHISCFIHTGLCVCKCLCCAFVVPFFVVRFFARLLDILLLYKYICLSILFEQYSQQ